MEPSSCHIAIIGAGFVGVAQAKILLAAGYTVSISNSRGPDSLRQQEKATGATALDISSAVAKADIVILAVPMGSIPSLQPILNASIRSDTIIIDSGNYYPSRDGHIEAIENGMAETAWVSQTLDRPVIKVFNNIVAAHIFRSARPKGAPDRVTLTVSGDDERSKAKVMDLVDHAGFDPYDAGSLAESWRQQPGTPAYCTEPTLQELIRLLASADREKARQMRDSTRELFEKLPPDYNPDVLWRMARLSAGLDLYKPQTWIAAMIFLWTVMRVKVLGHA